MENMDIYRTLSELEQVCYKIVEAPNDKEFLNYMNSLNRLLEILPASFTQRSQPLIITALLSMIPNKTINFSEKSKISLIDALSTVFKKSRVTKSNLYFNIFACILKEIYDVTNENFVKPVTEEYKLAIMKFFVVLNEAISWDVYPEIYKRENADKFSFVLRLCLKLAKDEKWVKLRLAAIDCLTSVTKTKRSDDLSDVVTLELISNVFIFFLPGITAGLMSICSRDENVNHLVIKSALNAWAKLINLLMRNYDCDTFNSTETPIEVKNLKNKEEVQEYINSIKKNGNWYKQHDAKLQLCGDILMKQTTHPKIEVRKELVNVVKTILEHCLSTLPKTSSRLIAVLITLSEDELLENETHDCMVNVSERLHLTGFRHVFNYLEENFFKTITKLPSIFNGLDEKEKLASLNLLIGYLKLFRFKQCKQILCTSVNLNRLLVSLMEISKLETINVRLLNEYSIDDLRMNPGLQTPWKRFRFNEKLVQVKLETVCGLLAQDEVFEIVYQYLFDVYVNDEENRMEVTLILNELLSSSFNENCALNEVEEIINMYVSPDYWNLPLDVDEKTNKLKVQRNVIQLCLQLEGIGKFALKLKESFHFHLLKILYFVLEKAGSGQLLLQTAGLQTLSNITEACGYETVNRLINENADYFSFQIVRKLKNPRKNLGVFNVLNVIIKHSDIDVLGSISYIIEDVLLQSCDKFQESSADYFLRIFRIFVEYLVKWLKIEIKVQALKTKSERNKEAEDFRLSNINENVDFSDDILGKTAEEMYAEDMDKIHELTDDSNEQDDEEVEEYKKPEPPLHVRLTVGILNRSLHFLPTKKPERKILVLEILKDGVEIIRDYEDELLPIVHKIWSPLVDRFKEFSTPLIINLSFNLLVTLARLSKDFIRARTVNEVLPSLLETLKVRSKESYLKDIGSAYRYTQSFKMQSAVLPKLGRLIYDLDVGESTVFEITDIINLYLSDKQPHVLQHAALEFYKTMFYFDSDLAKKLIEKLDLSKIGETERWKNIETIKETYDSSQRNSMSFQC